jgi:membrane fusion protein (multidrug efflux system)
MKQKVLFIAIAVVVVLGVVLMLRNKPGDNGKTAPAGPSAVPVTLGKVTTQRVEYVLQQVGTLVAAQEVALKSKIQGRVVDILFDEGKSVKKDDVLVRMDDVKILADIRNLTARIQQLEIRLENKKRSLERNRLLVEQDLVSREMYDNLETEIDEIKSQILQTQADLARQKDVLADTLIRAPFDGIAGPRTFSVGHYLNVGAPVVSVIDLNALEISFKAPEKYKQHISTGQAVYLTVDAYPGRKFTGRIFFIDPEVAVDTRTFLVKARVENSEKTLNPGMFARAELVTEVHENALTVPWESIIQTENETYVYAVEGKTAKKHPVRLGKVDADRAEVLDSKLSSGDAVIVEGKFSVREGSEIRAVKIDDAAEKSPDQGALEK